MTPEPKVMIAVEKDAARDVERAVLALGYEPPVRVSSGTEAVILLPEIEPDVVFIDPELGGNIDGIQAAQDIYENYRIPVIYLVESTHPAVLERARQTYPFGYLYQPVSEGSVQTAILAALEHHKVEEALRQRNLRLRHTQRMAELGYWEWDIERNQVTLSQESMAIFGFQDQQSTRSIQSVLERIHPQDLDSFRTRIRRVEQGNLVDEKMTFRIRRGGADMRWVETSPASVQNWDRSGEPRLWVGTVRDITEYMQDQDDRPGREAYLATINRITRAALKSDRTEEILHVMTESLGELFQARTCYLMSWDENWQRPVPVSAYGENREAFLALRFQKGEKSVTGKVLSSREPILIEDIHSTQYLLNGKRQGFPSRTYLYLPLISGERALGALSLVFLPSRDVTQNMIRKAEEISQQVALAVANSRLLEEIQERWEETETLRQAGMALINSENINQALETFLETVHKLVEFDSACVFLVHGDDLIMADQVGLPNPEDVENVIIPQDTYLLEKIMENKTSLIRGNVKSDRQFLGLGGTSDTRGWMGVPLISKDEVIGILTLDHHREGAYRDSDMGVVEVLANQAATAIQKLQLAEAEKDQLYITRTLQETSSLLASGLDVRDVLSSILQLLNRVVDYDQAYIAFVEPNDHLRLVAGRGPTDNAKIQTFYDRNARRIIQEFKGTPFQPVIHSDIKEVEGWIDFDKGIGIRSTINAPLHVRGELLGILFVDSKRPNAYTESMADTVMAFANQASLAINNAQLFEKNQRLAITDDLTGVYNRRYLVRFGEREVKRALRYQEPLSLIMFDLDHFKQINDEYGHVVGDKVLVEVAQRCQAAIRGIDILARYGGDEFIIILAKADLGVARHVAQRLKEVVEASPIDVQSGQLRVTLSVGVAELGEDHHNLDEILAQVDDALYAAKEAGRNCIRLG